MNGESVKLSVVIPVYNEEENLGPLLDELFPILRGLERPFEVICVDDASTDRSVNVIKELCDTYKELRLVRHGVNCGESAAEASGFSQSRGEVVITMDADLQNDPSDIPSLLKALEDSDAVCGVRAIREDSWLKRVSSWIANGFRNWITNDKVSDAGCTFRALRKNALAEIPVFNGMHRFLPTLLRFQGYRVVEIEVNHRPRIHGQSKYGIGNRMFRGIVDCFAMIWWRKRCVPGDRLREDSREAAQ